MAIKPVLKHTFYKNDGTRNALGKVYTYIAGTTTPTSTYTTSAADVANTNPIILDSKGECEMWVIGQIKVNVEETNDNGQTFSQVTGWPVDNIGSGVSNNDATSRWAGTATGSANALAIAPSPAISAYAIGQSFIFKSSASANTSTTTIAVSGLSAIAAQSNGAAMAGGEILASNFYIGVLDTITTCQISKLGEATLAELGAAALAGSASQAFAASTLTAATNVITPSLNGGQLAGMRNAIINGGMLVSQRAAVTLTNAFQYGLADRWGIYVAGGSAISGTDAISTGNAGISTGSMYGTTAGNWTTGQFIIGQRIEAKNIFGYNSKVITVSAKVYQNTGGARSFNVQLVRPTTTADTFSALTVLQTVTASQSVPDGVITTITATFAALGATDASLGLGLFIYDSAANTVVNKTYLVGDVQLEASTVATPFEMRPYGMELALCQRYYYRIQPGIASSDADTGDSLSATTFRTTSKFPVPMRTAPTALEQDGTATDYSIRENATVTVCSSVPTFIQGTVYQATCTFTVAAGLTVGRAGSWRTSAATTAGYLAWSAEL